MKYYLSDLFQGDFPVSQEFGANPDYYKQFGFLGHEGIDFATPVGTPILAPFDGVIVRDETDPRSSDYGQYITVWDPVQDCAVMFCHLSVNTANLGDRVKQGDIIGQTGNTGNTTGPHLHVNFFLTDANGYRLNVGNGYNGGLNILDSSLVDWNLGIKPKTDTDRINEIKAIINTPITDSQFRNDCRPILGV